MGLFNLMPGVYFLRAYALVAPPKLVLDQNEIESVLIGEGDRAAGFDKGTRRPACEGGF
jgi:hypothetical protein